MECDNCKAQFTTKQSLTYHIERKVCHKRMCPKCGAFFANHSAIVYHTTHNVCQKKKKIQLRPHHEKDNSELTKDELLTKVAVLEGKLQILSENPQTVNNVNNNIIIFPKEFGKEDMTYIHQKLGDVIKPLIENHTFSSIPRLFSQIHNNKDLPEYHNVYLPSQRSTYALVSDGKTFKHKSKKTIIDQIIEDKRSILAQYVGDNEEQFGKKILEKYERFQNKLDDDDQFMKELETEIGGLLLDMKEVIADDEKTRGLLERVKEGHFELEST